MDHRQLSGQSHANERGNLQGAVVVVGGATGGRLIKILLAVVEVTVMDVVVAAVVVRQRGRLELALTARSLAWRSDDSVHRRHGPGAGGTETGRGTGRSVLVLLVHSGRPVDDAHERGAP